MGTFFKTLFGSCLGTLIALVVLIVIGISTVVGLASKASDTTPPKVSSHSVFHLKLEGEIVEHAPINPFSDMNIPFLSERNKKIGLSSILSAIEEAKNNSNIDGIYLDCGSISCGYATMEEIRDALIDFKTAKKFVVAYADTYEQKTYYLASCANKVFINPQGMLDLKGIGAQKMFLKDLIEKLNINVQIAKVGTYKSYVEQYSRKDISPESRSQDLLWMNDMWSHIADQISKSRSISRSELENDLNTVVLLEETPTYLKLRLVDSLVYRDEATKYVNALCSTSADNKPKYLSLLEMSKIPSSNTASNTIAVLYCQGGIGTEGEITSKKFTKDLKKLREDSNIKAIVVRVNSPGGSAYESEQIWHEIQVTKAIKPVIISMGDYAASGGYYMSCGADAIVAHSTTITGSIGIFGVMPSFKGLANKLGVTFDVVETHPHASTINGIDPLTDSEMQQFQKHVDLGYKLFTKRCYEGRKMQPSDLEAIAQGRVWSGSQGLNNHLVDKIGGIQTAVALAAQKANITNYKTENYPQLDKYYEEILKSFTGEDNTLIQSKVLGDLTPYIKLLTETKNIKGIQARMPYQLIMK